MEADWYLVVLKETVIKYHIRIIVHFIFELLPLMEVKRHHWKLFPFSIPHPCYLPSKVEIRFIDSHVGPNEERACSYWEEDSSTKSQQIFSFLLFLQVDIGSVKWIVRCMLPIPIAPYKRKHHELKLIHTINQQNDLEAINQFTGNVSRSHHEEELISNFFIWQS